MPVPDDVDNVDVGPITPDGRFVSVSVETAKAPRSTYVFDWQSNTLTPWALASAPEIDLSKFAVARLESYPARDGTKIPMFVRRPAQCAPDASALPVSVVVEFHGGPEGQSAPGFSPASAAVRRRRVRLRPAQRARQRRLRQDVARTPTTGPSGSRSSPTSRTRARYIRARLGRERQGAEGRRRRRQLRRLLDADWHDVVRRRVRRRRVDRRDLEPAHVPHRTPRRTAASCAPRSTAIRRRTRDALGEALADDVHRQASRRRCS